MRLNSAVDHVGNQCHQFSLRFVDYSYLHCRYVRPVSDNVPCKNLETKFCSEGRFVTHVMLYDLVIVDINSFRFG